MKPRRRRAAAERRPLEVIVGRSREPAVVDDPYATAEAVDEATFKRVLSWYTVKLVSDGETK